MTELEMIRNNPAIDPHLHIWGWEIPVYLFLGGMTAGLMVFSALLAGKNEGKGSPWARVIPFAAPVLLSLGMVALFLDLAHKLYVWRFYLAFKPGSPMSWGAWILLAIYPATLLLGLSNLTSTEVGAIGAHRLTQKFGLAGLLAKAHALSLTQAKTLRFLNIMLGVALGFYTGVLLGTLGARPVWASLMLGPLFLVSGLSAGAAFLMLFPLKEAELSALRRWDLWAIGLEGVLLALYFVSLATGGGKAGLDALHLFFGGRYTAVFWSFVVMLGLLTPFVLEMLERNREIEHAGGAVSGRPVVAVMGISLSHLVAPSLVLLGGLSLRWILVLAGQ